MGYVHIAFIECVLKGHDWKKTEDMIGHIVQFAQGVYKAGTDGSPISLVDVGGTRRYYTFRSGSVVTIMNNVISFEEDNSTLEMGVDESKKFPNKPKIDD